MMCFADKTFCPYLECANVKCDRRYTDKVVEAAARWWGKPNAPVSLYGEKPECFEENEDA